MLWSVLRCCGEAVETLGVSRRECKCRRCDLPVWLSVVVVRLFVARLSIRNAMNESVRCDRHCIVFERVFWLVLSTSQMKKPASRNLQANSNSLVESDFRSNRSDDVRPIATQLCLAAVALRF